LIHLIKVKTVMVKKMITLTHPSINKMNLSNKLETR